MATEFGANLSEAGSSGYLAGSGMLTPRSQSIFNRFDKDKDGVISRAEAMTLFMELIGQTATDVPHPEIEAQMNQHFDETDVNKDGVLQKDEFDEFIALIDGTSTVLGAAGPLKSSAATYEKKPTVAYVEPAPEPEGTFMSLEYFHRFDVNRDAKLDLEEATSLLQATVRQMGLTSSWVTREFVKEQVGVVVPFPACTRARHFCEAESPVAM